MFEVGEMVEFWLPDGNKFRYGKIVRKQRDICIIVSNMLKRRRIYKVKESQLNNYRGEVYYGKPKNNNRMFG